MIKTNALRILEKAKISFRTVEYEVDENNLAGEEVARKAGMPLPQVFKTLVAKGERKGYCVFCIPVDKELDLKKAAAILGDKKVEMLPMKDLLSITGYIRGGCSPVGMKKKFPTFYDESAFAFDEISVSAGVRGCQVILNPKDLVSHTQGVLGNITC
ncbi:Cys-tRNA(Pro) deacylase [Anaeromicropila populeti]|uniref:Cys-tRNA(Pro)/Cys-tRNA(Cys) deacylase n=1 Tax=Anaeromicropila populeti TaxID=37658 RepID=A0A1I6L2Z5_9FIRM|nr:Cys-tRNA(Pro)/Cys-tRNA(Cys) deacylase [Anaeromicropila populeti]